MEHHSQGPHADFVRDRVSHPRVLPVWHRSYATMSSNLQKSTSSIPRYHGPALVREATISISSIWGSISFAYLKAFCAPTLPAAVHRTHFADNSPRMFHRNSHGDGSIHDYKIPCLFIQRISPQIPTELFRLDE